MSGSDRYKAFISYAHRDAAWAARLQRKLENFRFPEHADQKWPLRPIFLDRSELASSPDLSESIEEALRNSDALIVVCSPAAAQSKWVNAEILFYKRLAKKRIYAIVIAGEPGADDPGEACFPDALRFQLDANGDLTSIPAEPLAADARSGRDGSDAVLKLVAGLLDVPFDTLKLRQQRRRVRRAFSVAAGATAMLILTSYLAVTAIVAQKDAEHRRDQAEGLISFMLGDLRERLQPVGRLDVLDGVGEQALEYFSSLRDSELTSESMLTRAMALRQIGEVRVAQGRTSESLIALNEALTLLNNSSTENEPIRLFELGQVNYWIADAYFRDLRLDEAQVYIEKYLAISRQLVELEPDNSDYELELLYAESNLGTLAFRENDVRAAREYFGNALAVIRNLVLRQPGEDNNLELAITVSWLGAVEASTGNYAVAQRWYEEELQLHRALVAAGESPARKHRLGRALWLLADTRQQAGQLGAAVTALDESVQLYRELADYDPQNFKWQRELAWTLALLARDSYAFGTSSAKEARATLSLASEVMDRTSNDAGAEAPRVTAAIATEHARIELLEGFPERASPLLGSAVRQLAPLSIGQDRIRVLPLYARALYLSSESALALGDGMESKKIAESALQELNVREDDPIEIRAYAALLSFRAGSPDAERMRSSIATTEYDATVYVPNTDAEKWWQQEFH